MDIFADRSAKPMLIGGEGDAFDSPDFLFELKLDGERCLAYVDRAGTTLINRRGRQVLGQFPELADLHRHTDGRCILDGEIVVGAGAKPDFELVKQRTVAKRPHAIERLAREHPATFVALDILYRDGVVLTSLPLDQRRQVLNAAVDEDEAGRLARVRATPERGVAFFEVVRRQGLEGLIAKRRDSVYRMGRRTRDWIKIKNWMEDRFVIAGYIAAANTAVVSLVLGQYQEDGVLVYKGRVLLGTSRDDFRRVLALPRVDRPPVDGAPRPAIVDAVWTAPRLVCRVGFLCWTDGLGIRQPSYKGLLPDDDPTTVREFLPDCDADRCGATG